MKRTKLLLLLAIVSANMWGQTASVCSPDSLLKVEINVNDGRPSYSVVYNNHVYLEQSPLGFTSNVGDFSQGMAFEKSQTNSIHENYKLDRIKKSDIEYIANELKVSLKNKDNKPLDITFRVSNNNVAFRYEMPRYGETGSIVIKNENTGFNLPSNTTTFLTPQSDAMIGWKRTKPSYEEEYKADAPLLTKSQYGHGYTFPCLFHVGDKGWMLISETGVDSRYCASHLSDVTPDGLYTIAFPMEEENNGNGSVSPGMALPAETPWRTITVGETLKPIVETTIPWDVVQPRFESAHEYKYGRGTWSWIMWQDSSINYDDQVAYIDLAASMGYEFVLIDNWWDKQIGRDNIVKLVNYARSKNVDLILWYSSSGYWNDIEQSPVNIMDNPISRKKEMKWLHEIGVKGIKVDFFGGDKQETMRLYEAILSDADDNGLMVIFHGCTLPRGWERMYPNYVGSEAVLASENLIFNQHFDDNEAFNACLHPFIRNAVGCMEFGGTLLNKRHNRTNDGGCVRKTTDIFQIATAILFQNPIQNFALAPNNLTDSPKLVIDFMKDVPTTWDETIYIDGYPRKYCILARRHSDKWYIAGINATDKPLKMKIKLDMLNKGDNASLYTDDNKLRPVLKNITIKKAEETQITMQPEGGFVIVK